MLLDMNFQAGINSGNEGLFWMKEILKHDNNISIVMITAYGDVELAVKAIREGAVDFILKPWNNEKLAGNNKCSMETQNFEAGG
ncbi:MAG: response regulator [Marinilabiliales bacterium]|nr:response regulator [Marinilabiliales bacterium]